MADLASDAIHWGDEVTLREFVESFDGPQLIRLRCETSCRGAGEDGDALLGLGTDVDTDAMFLAYSRRLRTKVYGQPLVRDGHTAEYVVGGSMLEIPKDYPGMALSVLTHINHEFVYICNQLCVEYVFPFTRWGI